MTLTASETATPSFTAPDANATLHFRLITVPTPDPSTPSLFIAGIERSAPDWVTVTVGTGGQSTAPAITGVTISEAAGEDNGWDAGDDVDVVLTFDEAVDVDTAGGTPSATVQLEAHPSGTTSSKSAAYASGSGTTALTLRYTVPAGEGPYTAATLVENSLALNGGTIRSSASQGDATLAHAGVGQIYTREIPQAPASAAFSGMPERHDGESAFEVRLTFSAEPSVTSYTTVRDRLIDVTGARITRAKRAVKDSNREWRLTVVPRNVEDVTLTLPVRPCTAANAACIGGQPLASAATATIEGPVFTAAFSNVPAEHDGSAFTVDFDLSAEPRELSFRTVRDRLFAATGARIAKAKRRTAGNDTGWRLTVVPEGYGEARLALRSTIDCSRPPGVCNRAGRRLEGPLELTVSGPPTLSVADAEVEEGEGAELRFVVELSRAVDETVTVDYATSDGSATAGVDYTKTAGTLTFNPGETAHKVAVEVLDDAHDEGSETVTLTLSNATPARVKIADATATGTITNTDPMPKAWMVRFGRTVGTHVVDALDARLGARGGSSITVGGVTLGAGTGAEETEDDDPFALPAWTRSAREEESRTPSGQELLLGTRFHLSSAREPGAPGLAAWGRVTRSGFEGEENDVAFDGDVTSGLIGFDAEWAQGLAGIMLSHSEGDGRYRLNAARRQDEGTVESTMTGIYPYAEMKLGPATSAWALAGAGWGELTLVQEREDGKRAMPTDLTMRLAAAGLRGALLDERTGDAMTVRAKTDALWVGTKSADTEQLAATEGSVSRVRVMLEGARTFEIGRGGQLTPLAEIGVRSDGGDAETGLGLELGAGLAFAQGRTGIEAKLRTLAAHEDTKYEEWGASASIQIAPDGAGRGLTLALRPEWGATASAREHLWGAGDARELADESQAEAGRRIALDAGYGVGARGATLTPFAGAVFGAEGERKVRAGIGWRRGGNVAVRAEAVQSGRGEEATTAIGVKAALRF